MKERCPTRFPRPVSIQRRRRIFKTIKTSKKLATHHLKNNEATRRDQGGGEVSVVWFGG
jgi:hypothetical protein